MFYIVVMIRFVINDVMMCECQYNFDETDEYFCIWLSTLFHTTVVCAELVRVGIYGYFVNFDDMHHIVTDLQTRFAEN